MTKEEKYKGDDVINYKKYVRKICWKQREEKDELMS